MIGQYATCMWLYIIWLYTVHSQQTALLEYLDLTALLEYLDINVFAMNNCWCLGSGPLLYTASSYMKNKESGRIHEKFILVLYFLAKAFLYI